MSRIVRLEHEFVEQIPDDVAEGTLYVCMRYSTVVHQCCCGCGNEVVTPLSPTDWKLIFDGENVSLDPSIGNWSFPCRSHYWIRNGKVTWADAWTSDQVTVNRRRDRQAKEAAFGGAPVAASERARPGIVGRILQWLRKH